MHLDEKHHQMMNGPRIAQSLGEKYLKDLLERSKEVQIATELASRFKDLYCHVYPHTFPSVEQQREREKYELELILDSFSKLYKAQNPDSPQ